MRVALSLAALLALAVPAVAQQAQTGGSMPGMQGMSDMKAMTAYQQETMASMEKMNKAMQQGMMDPDPSMAWMKSMAAHHQGAVDMSEIVLKHTKDEEVRKEARKTIQENEKSLNELNAKMKKS